MTDEPTLFDVAQKIPDSAMNRYFNTTNLPEPELKERELRAGTQNRIILDFFKSHPGQSFTPFEVQRYVNLNNVPITSIRRAMTTLTDLGYLFKTDIKRPGIYNDQNYTWRLKNYI